MPAKKKQTPNPRELTRAEAFYAEKHYKKKPVEAIAEDISVPVMSVQLYFDALEAAGYEPPQEPTETEKALKQAGFASRAGTVAMTRGGSEIGDELRGSAYDPHTGKRLAVTNEKFYRERLGKGIHKIRPDEPIR